MSRLKQQINMPPHNPRREYPTAVFKCEKCEKTFPSENNLNSHIKRRHNDENSLSSDNDDKLQTEIKELKERLNTTDKLLQQIHMSDEPSVEKSKTSEHLLTDLEKKFCTFREQVEHEITSLHLEKNMYEEKYTKLFDLLLKSKEKPHVVFETTGTMTSEEIVKTAREPFKNKETTADGSTQTEQLELNRPTEEETVQKIPINNTEDPNMKSSDGTSQKLEEKLTTLSEDIDNKISSSMNMIKNQMQTFWEQMKPTSHQKNETSNDSIQRTEVEDSTETAKPQVKPRTKLLLKTYSSPDIQQHQPLLTSVRTKLPERNLQNETTPKTKQNLDKLVEESVSNRRNSVEVSETNRTEDETIEVLKAPNHLEDDDDDDSSSETESERTNDSISNVQSMEAQVKHVDTYSSNDQANIVEQINKIIDQRFHKAQSFLVSRKKFHRAMEILSEHGNLKKQVQRDSPKHKFQKSSPKRIRMSQKNVPKTNTVRIRLNRPFKRNNNKEIPETVPTPLVEIKHKSLFESDSETERDFPQKQYELEGDKSKNFQIRGLTKENRERNSTVLEVSPSTSNITKKVLFENLSSDESTESDIATKFRVKTRRN